MFQKANFSGKLTMYSLAGQSVFVSANEQSIRPTTS